MVKRDEILTQEEPMADQLKCSSIKQEPLSANDVSISCHDYMDVPNPGWFGKGIRKIKSKKRRR